MQLKISKPDNQPHSGDVIQSMGWISAQCLYSIGDDHKIVKWSSGEQREQELAKLPDDLFTTDMQWCIGLSGSKKQGLSFDSFVLGATDGKFFFVSSTGRVEKAVEAHKGALICLSWSPDGTSLATGGEDGSVKIWSRSGMLRTTLAQKLNAIYAIGWSPDADKVVFSYKDSLCIKSLQPSSKPKEWKAHDQLILCLDWNINNGLICSASEDNTYKIWDSFGRNLYTSAPEEHPITSVAWSPDGQMLTLGSFNSIRLCDDCGISHHQEKLSSGSVVKIKWCPDNTKLALSCADGTLFYATIVEKECNWGSLSATLVDTESLRVYDLKGNVDETLELHTQILQFCIGYEHVVIVTIGKLHIYNINHLTTPMVVDVKDTNSGASLIVQTHKFFAIALPAGVSLYFYNGRFLSQPKLPALRPETLTINTLTVNQSFVALVERSDRNKVYLFDSQSGKLNEQTIVLKENIERISLEQTLSSKDTLILIQDCISDLYIVKARSPTTSMVKIASQVTSFSWHSHYPLITYIDDVSLKTLTYSNSAYLLRGELLRLSMLQQSIADIGKSPTVNSFIDNRIEVQRNDGILTQIVIPTQLTILHAQVQKANWPAALKLCRLFGEDSIWAAFACLAVQYRNLEAMEAAFAALRDMPKVEALTYIKSIHNPSLKKAELCLFSGDTKECETILIQNGLFFRLIMVHLSLYNWQRALDLAIKYKKFVEIVVGYRQKFMQTLNRQEYLQDFRKYNTQLKINWDQIAQTVKAETKKEEQSAHTNGTTTT